MSFREIAGKKSSQFSLLLTFLSYLLNSSIYFFHASQQLNYSAYFWGGLHEQNRASSSGGAVHADGASVSFANCSFVGNTAALLGGAIAALSAPTLTVASSSFVRNTVLPPAGAATNAEQMGGGALFVQVLAGGAGRGGARGRVIRGTKIMVMLLPRQDASFFFQNHRFIFSTAENAIRCLIESVRETLFRFDRQMWKTCRLV